MGSDDAIIAGMIWNCCMQVAGTEIEEAVRTFNHVANPAKTVLPQNLFCFHGSATRTIQEQLMDMMGEGIVRQAEQRNEHAAIPAWNRGAVIERCAGRSSGDGIEQANGINEAGVIAYSHASGPAIVAAGENDIHFIVGRGTMIGSVKLARTVKGQS